MKPFQFVDGVATLANCRIVLPRDSDEVLVSQAEPNSEPPTKFLFSKSHYRVVENAVDGYFEVTPREL